MQRNAEIGLFAEPSVLPAKRAGELAGMNNMLYAAKWARRRQYHLGIQDLVAGRVGYDPAVFVDLEIGTIKRLVVNRADKNKFHRPVRCPLF
jgi:hypothetical protein